MEDNEPDEIDERQDHDTEQNRDCDQGLTEAGQRLNGIGQGDGVADPTHIEADKRQRHRHGQAYEGCDRIGEPTLDREPVSTNKDMTTAWAVRPLPRSQGRQRDDMIAVGTGAQTSAS